MAVEDFEYVCVALMILSVCLITYVDFRRLRIPDVYNAVLAAAGAGYQYGLAGIFPLKHFLAAGVLFLSLFLVRKMFFRLRGTAGLGLGDVKMAAAATFWIDPLHIPQFLMIASALGLAVIALMYARGAKNIQSFRLPFGPFLALSMLAVWGGERVTPDLYHPYTSAEFAQ